MLFFPRRRFEHLGTLNRRNHLSEHDVRRTRLSWKQFLDYFFIISLKISVLLARSSLQLIRKVIYIQQNRAGPSTDPSGIPFVTGASSDSAPFSFSAFSPRGRIGSRPAVSHGRRSLPSSRAAFYAALNQMTLKSLGRLSSAAWSHRQGKKAEMRGTLPWHHAVPD